MKAFGQHVQLDAATGVLQRRLIEWSSVKGKNDGEALTVLCWCDWSVVPVLGTNKAFADVPANLGYHLRAGLASAQLDHEDFANRFLIKDANSISSFPANGFRWCGVADHLILECVLSAASPAQAYLHAMCVPGNEPPPRYRVPMARTPNPGAPSPTPVARFPYCTSRWRATQQGGPPAVLNVYEPAGNLLFTIPVASLSDFVPIDARAFYVTQSDGSYLAGARVTLECE